MHKLLAENDYLSDDAIASVTYLADRLAKPVLVEGPAGTGKTALAKAVADAIGARLIRLQCYEGLDESKALYEWNYRKQLLRIQAGRPEGAGSEEWHDLEEDIFAEEFMLTRPLLEAISASDPVVLLIDEVDRVELETEALDARDPLGVPGLHPRARHRARRSRSRWSFSTSNNTRELSEALKRRCLYLYVGYPTVERERDIILSRVPGITKSLGRADRPGRALAALDRPEEGAVGLRDPGLGAHARGARHARRSATRTRRRRCTSCSSTSPTSSGPPRSCSAVRGPLLNLLGDFIGELRAAGIPVSMSEHVDAARAVEVIDLGDRALLRATLAATLVKDGDHLPVFYNAFDVFFSHALVGEPPTRLLGEAADARARTRARAARAVAGQSPRRRRGRSR